MSEVIISKLIEGFFTLIIVLTSFAAVFVFLKSLLNRYLKNDSRITVSSSYIVEALKPILEAAFYENNYSDDFDWESGQWIKAKGTILFNGCIKYGFKIDSANTYKEGDVYVINLPEPEILSHDITKKRVFKTTWRKLKDQEIERVIESKKDEHKKNMEMKKDKVIAELLKKIEEIRPILDPKLKFRIEVAGKTVYQNYEDSEFDKMVSLISTKNITDKTAA